MGAELEEMKRLVERMTTAATTMQEENLKLITALNARPAAPVGGAAALPAAAAVDPAVVRGEKMAKLNFALRKSIKIKDFKEAQDVSIRDWIKRFDQEIQAVKKMSGINDNLTRDEMVDCMKDKLDYAVIKRLDTSFKAKDDLLTWAAVTVDELKSVLIEEYGTKETDVSSVLIQFGPNRFKKTPEMSVARFYYLWQEQLPECLLPEGNVANERFVELIKKALFYFCLNDKYLQEQLCNLKGEHITFKMFYDEACLVEQKRKSFQEIGVSSSHLDSASGVTVNKWDARNK